MKNQRAFKIFVSIVALAGSSAIVYALFFVRTENLTPSAVILILGALLITSRLTLSLPRSNSHLSFSDTMIFFAFIFFSGEMAVLLAVIEISVSCFFLKLRGVVFEKNALTFNITGAAMATAGTLIVWKSLPYFGLTNNYLSTPKLVTALGILALAHFGFVSLLASGYYALKRGQRLLQTWKREGFSISMTQIAGAGLAGVAYKLISYGDLLTISVSLLILGIAYLNYRQLIRDINESIDQAEQAEREKTEIAKAKAEEVEEHAGQLKHLLEKEEDISRDLRKSKEDLEYAAYHDNLTDLPNRAYLMERLNLLLQMGPDVAKHYYVLFLDLSRFKNINDSLGHTIGDEVLRVVALRLRRCLRDEDTIARLGGDEFAIILNDLSSLNEAKSYAYRIYDHLTQPYVIQGNKIFSDLFIGIAPFDHEQLKPEDILRDADIAMHSAKEENVSVAVFDKDVRAKYLEYIRLEGDLRYAVERKELALHFQPLISLKDGELVGFEALLRWYHSELGFISPGVFIPISEDTGSIIPITKWVLREACTRLESWRKISPEHRNLVVGVNISGRHLADKSLIGDVAEALEDSGLPASSLKLEITESTAMETAERTIETLNEISGLGVNLSIDDFGTGYSSLSYLHRLPFDTLKIDRSFVMSVGEEREDLGILQTIVSLTKNLRKEVVAEGIETEKQLSLLRDLGCDYGQGFLFSKPLPHDEMETLLYQKRAWLPYFEDRTREQKYRPDLSELPHGYA